MLLVWANASSHVSQRVWAWIKAHHRRVKRDGGVQIVACRLPIQSPWLYPKLTAAKVIERVCEYSECEHVGHLTQKVT